MRIAMIGQKGLPASHGGVEQHVQQLGSRLAALGHEVLVYTRPAYSNPRQREFMGMRLISIPSIPTKHLDAITHSVLCSLDSRHRQPDIVHYHAIGPCLAAPLVKRGQQRIVATVHGQDWRRAKWNAPSKFALRTAERMALTVPDATISVSESLASAYEGEGYPHVVYIPNGICLTDSDDLSLLSEFGLKSGEYVLYVGRLVPEKGAHYLLEAWNRLGSGRKLVVVGDSSFTDDYVAALRALATDDVIFTGYLYGARLATAFRHAALFVLPSDLEGLPIVLLESLGYGTPVLASDIPPNREVLGEQGAYFEAASVDDLTTRLGEVLRRIDDMKIAAIAVQHQVLREYDWDIVARDTEELYTSLMP